MSPPEAALWARRRARRAGQPVFRRQHPIGPYVADFYCAGARLVIEIDGAHHGDAAQGAHDQQRDRYMEAGGYKIIRVAAADVMRDPDETAQGAFDTAIALMRGRRG
jgi:very-short-patch-repair endonuclease